MINKKLTSKQILEKEKLKERGDILKSNQKIKKLVQKAIKILKENKVTKAGIFGSYARGEQKKDSDIDILIEFDGSLLDLVRLERILKEKLKKKIDLLSYGGINPRLKEIILNEEVKII